MVPEKEFLFLNYACGFAPLFHQSQTKCYSTTLHKVNDTTWLELFPEIGHSSGTLRVLKWLDARAKLYPWSHTEVPQALVYHDIYIPGFLWIQSEGLYAKPLKNQRYQGTGSGSRPDPGRAVQNHTWLQGTDDLVKEERKRKDLKWEGKLNFYHCDSKMQQFMKCKNLFCVALKEYFKITIDQQLFLKMNCIFLTQCKRFAKVT